MDSASHMPHMPMMCAGLVDTILKGDCVLVLGPRIAMPDAVCGETKTPIDEYLATKLLERLDEPTASSASVSFREALTRFERRFGPAMLRSFVTQLVAPLDDHPTQLHKDLASLPFRMVLVATPDRMMQSAFKAIGKRAVLEDCYDYTRPGGSQALKVLPSAEAPIVYNLFGSHGQPQSMVLTDKNLLDYLVQITRERPPLPDPIRATLRSPVTHFLFVGFGFTNWWLRLLLKVLDVTGVDSRSLSLALEDARTFATPAAKENKGFFEVAGSYVDAGDWEALASELASQYRSTLSQSDSRPTAVPTTGGRPPVVFLSYASEDIDLVTALRHGLEARGIAVWQDVGNLRVGQNWEAKIVEVIKRVDYFLFVQTENMDRRTARREDGVYNRELKVALDRARDKPAGEVFILHVTVGQCAPRPEQSLRELHHMAVDTDEGVSRLATQILESFASAPDSLAVQT